jgi:hypothetical protein
MKSPEEIAEFHVETSCYNNRRCVISAEEEMIFQSIHCSGPNNEVTLMKYLFSQARNRQGLLGTTLSFLQSLLST